VLWTVWTRPEGKLRWYMLFPHWLSIPFDRLDSHMADEPACGVDTGRTNAVASHPDLF
jgi:hypothetical protein